ncbi:morphogenic membrane protein MmpA [Streptomyces anulatus]
MNASRAAVRTEPFDPAQRRMALGMLLGSAVGLVWLGAMLYTLAGWIF